MGSLRFEPLLSSFAWSLLAIAGSGALIWYALHRPGGCARARWWTACALIGAALCATLVMLLNPTWIEPIPPPAGKPLLTVLVDASASMATADQPEQQTRFQAAGAIATRLADDLSDRFDVRVRTFAATPAAADVRNLAQITPDGQATDLSAAIAGSLEDDRPQGQALLVVSDGAHNAPDGAVGVLAVARMAKAMAAPIYTSTIGGSEQPPDLEVIVPRSQELAFAGQAVPVRVRVHQHGTVARQAKVELVSGDAIVDTQTVDLRSDGDGTAVLHVKAAESGLYQYDVRVEHFAAEMTAANNRALFQLRVVKEPIRILVLEGKPYWDCKFLLKTLAADASLEVDLVVRMAEGRYLRRRLRLAPPDQSATVAAETSGNSQPDGTDDAPPVRRDEAIEVLADASLGTLGDELLRNYRVVVLGRDAESFLAGEGIDALTRWLSRDGGSLVCYRGSPVASADQKLNRLLPVRWAPGKESRFRVQVTQRGENISWLAPNGAPQSLALLPSLASASSTRGIRPLAVVLGNSETGDGSPVLIYQPVGSGRAVAIEGAGMWRWAFLAPEFKLHDDVYSALWQSLIRWLVTSAGLGPGQDVAFRIDRVSFQTGEAVSATLLRRAASPQPPITVELRREGADTVRTIAPMQVDNEQGVFQVPFGRLEAGRYQARLQGLDDAAGAATDVAFEVGDHHAEQLDIAARPDLMSRLATESGGQVFEQPNAAAISTEFAEHLSKTRPVRVRRVTAWDRWWVLTGVIALWGAAWTIRRSGGLI